MAPVPRHRGGDPPLHGRFFPRSIPVAGAVVARRFTPASRARARRGLIHTTTKPEVITGFLLLEVEKPRTELDRWESERILRRWGRCAVKKFQKMLIRLSVRSPRAYAARRPNREASLMPPSTLRPIRLILSCDSRQRPAPVAWSMANQKRRPLPHLTGSTNVRLGRALSNALRGRAHTPRRQLDEVVAEASRELRSAGLSDPAVLSMLGEIVEDTGRECGADRPSLMTGKLRWVPVQARVLESAKLALAVSPA